jgi:hypothetical protein
LLVSLKQGGQCKYNICIEQRKNWFKKKNCSWVTPSDESGK